MQGSGNEILNSDHLDAFYSRYFALEHVSEREFGGSGVTARFSAHVDFGSGEILAVGIGAVDAACKET